VLFSTAAASEVIVACAVQDFNGSQTYSAGSGYAIESAEPVLGSACEDKTVSSVQSATSASMSSNAATGWVMVLGSFRAYVQGTTVSSRSDALADSRPSATSNHTFVFTVNTAVYGSSVSGSSTLTLSLDPAFTFPDVLDCGDIDAASSVQFGFNWPSCAPTTTAWGFSVQQSGISFVQQNATNPGVATQNSTAFPNSNTAGDLIVAVAAWDNVSASISSITDTAGNAYVSAAGPVNWNGAAPTYRQQIFYAKNIKGRANTVTATLNAASTSFFQLFIFEYSGADTISPLDVTHSATSSSGTAIDSGSATTTYPNELIFGAGNSFNVTGAGTGFVDRSEFNTTRMEDKFVATASSYNATAASDGSAWVMMMATFRAAGGSTLTLIPLTDTAVHVATGTPVTIKIGSNATVGQQGGHWITNPSTAGIYTVSVGGTFGGSGNILVSINSGVSVQVSIPESLAFTVSSVAAVNCTADDGASVTAIGTSPTSVSLGTFPVNTFSIGCQDLVVSTNAGAGYSLTTQETSAMSTVDGRFTIPDSLPSQLRW
jgi:hypothetical protein